MIEISGGVCHHVPKSLDLFRSRQPEKGKAGVSSVGSGHVFFIDILAEPSIGFAFFDA